MESRKKLSEYLLLFLVYITTFSFSLLIISSEVLLLENFKSKSNYKTSKKLNKNLNQMNLGSEVKVIDPIDSNEIKLLSASDIIKPNSENENPLCIEGTADGAYLLVGKITALSFLAKLLWAVIRFSVL